MSEFSEGQPHQTEDEDLFYRRNRSYILDERSEALKNRDPAVMEIYEKVKGILAKKILFAYKNTLGEDFSQGASLGNTKLSELLSLIGHDASVLAPTAYFAGDSETAKIFYRIYYTFIIEGRRQTHKRLELGIKGEMFFDEAPELKDELSKLAQETYNNPPEGNPDHYPIKNLFRVLEESKPELELMAAKWR